MLYAPAMRLRSSLLWLLVLGVAPAFGAGERAVQDTDLWRLTWIGDPQISPDGTRVAYVKVVADQKHTGYETSIWLVGSRGDAPPERLTSGTHDGQPRWSPDGRRLVFVRAGDKPKAEDSAPQIFLLSMSGGEPVPLTDLPKGAGDPTWSPDGKRIAFSSTTSPEDLAKKAAKEKGAHPDDDADHESDVKYVTRAEFRTNDSGYVDLAHPGHLWIVALPSAPDDKPVPRQLTAGKFDDGEFLWAKDGHDILYTTDQRDEPYYELPRTELYAVSAEGGAARLIATVPLGTDGISLSPDGRRLAFRAEVNEPIRSYMQPDLFVLELAPGATPKNLTTSFDADVGAGLIGDCAPPRAAGSTRPLWAADGKSIIDVTTIQGRANLMRFTLDGKAPTAVTQGDQAVQDFVASADGKTLVALVSTPLLVGDLFVVGAGPQRAITDVNGKLAKQLSLRAPEEIWYPSFDGKKIQAWLQKPPDFDPAKKYRSFSISTAVPTALMDIFLIHEFQWMAARGYVVLYVNPRGSTSYGQEFGNIIQYKYPGDDYKDLMAGVDEVIRRGYIDATRLGVTGGSGGGVLTNWTVTKTNRFAAAVSQRDISDWAAWWYTTDFWLYFPSWFKKPPFQNEKEYRDRSSLTFVDRIHTPLAFILGDGDWRTPPESGGETLFRALKYLKRPTAMVRFPGETHELSRSGQPWHRVERLQAIIGWFDKYLLGKDVEQYRAVGK